ncbi:hypothetical protein QUF55_01155 [Clostridiaceae bacterium HSG29]|nr:hypothetical protein [Clostridiaceae bacterium HSG29]
MKISKVIELINGEILIGSIDDSINFAFSSDLMSDVLAFVNEDTALLTGLVNNQVIRTAEMLDLRTIIFVRGKVPPQEVVNLAKERGMTLLITNFTMFESSGVLFKNGIEALRISNE